jgi:hypothetical protein
LRQFETEGRSIEIGKKTREAFLFFGSELRHAWVYLNVDVFGATQAEIQGITSIATSPGCRFPPA